MRVEISGVDELMKDLNKFSEAMKDEIPEKLMKKGADVCVDEWKKGIKSHRHIDTGEMLRNVKQSKKTRKGIKYRVIYPRGIDREGTNREVTNAAKAYMLHYGVKGKPGDRFVDKIEDNTEKNAFPVMEKEFDKYLKKEGLI